MSSGQGSWTQDDGSTAAADSELQTSSPIETLGLMLGFLEYDGTPCLRRNYPWRAHSTRAQTRHTRELTLVKASTVHWRKVTAEGLDLDYAIVLSPATATKVLRLLEDSVRYFSGALSRIYVFGKWCDIPRQQVAFGDHGLSYKFSGTTVPALPWPPVISQLREMVHAVTGVDFNFVLVNRYRNGRDHIGEHRDDENDLDGRAPIASLSLGQHRDFVLRHRDARKRGPGWRDIPAVKLKLEHGSLLLMNPPTNHVWYHSLPARLSCPGVRINLTFRRIWPKVLHGYPPSSQK